MTKDTRDISHHYAAGARERKMHKTITKIKEDMKNEKNNINLDSFIKK